MPALKPVRRKNGSDLDAFSGVLLLLTLKNGGSTLCSFDFGGQNPFNPFNLALFWGLATPR